MDDNRTLQVGIVGTEIAGLAAGIALCRAGRAVEARYGLLHLS
jgi:transketolase C-terminal domain/subunit